MVPHHLKTDMSPYGQETKVRLKRRELEPAKAADRQAQTGIVPIWPWFQRTQGVCPMRGTRRKVPP
jgi:hypothetical protein